MTGRALAAIALPLAALLAAGCSSSGAAGTGQAAAPAGAQAGATPLVTAAQGRAGNSWAVVQMGGQAALHENFWELFTSRADGSGWRLATPRGVADNGGLVVAAGRGPGSLVTGFVPSQDLTFSPLATTSDNGARWSPGLAGGGLAGLPDALAAGPDGQLLALLGSGAAQLSAAGGTTWRQLAGRTSLAATTAGRACGLVRLTGAAFGVSGQPLLAGQCSRPGQLGIFSYTAGSWRPAGPALPAALAGLPVQVARLADTGAGVTALLIAGTGSKESLIAAWSAGRAGRWTVAGPFRMEGSQLRSASFGRGGAVAVVLSGGQAEVLAGPGASWRPLPALPAGTATLLPSQRGAVVALATTASTLAVWRLASGAAAWTRAQFIKVPIPYGSSG